MNTREVILDILLELAKEKEYSNVLIASVLEKYDYLETKEKAFIKRVTEGTIERQIQIDYVLNQFSKVPVKKMKPLIRELLRMSTYQLLFMEHTPDAAVCNEAVKLAKKRKFQSLQGYVNGVLRSIARGKEAIAYPKKEEEPLAYLSVCYSMPLWLTEQMVQQYGLEKSERMLANFLQRKPVSIRLEEKLPEQEQKSMLQVWQRAGVAVQKHPYLPYAVTLDKADGIRNLYGYKEGYFAVQDVSSMLVGEIANPKKGDYIIDMCAAPGGKSLHVADKMGDYGIVDARDVSQYKVDMIEENVHRTDCINVQAHVMDATVFDVDSELKADVVLADVPCSGYGVIGKKPEIKYRVTAQKQEEIVILQRTILDNAAEYVKPGGVLVFSTCTIAKEENEENMLWFMNNHPFKLESIDPYLPEELHSETTALGYLQLLPGVHKTDGFFIAKFRRK